MSIHFMVFFVCCYLMIKTMMMFSEITHLQLKQTSGYTSVYIHTIDEASCL